MKKINIGIIYNIITNKLKDSYLNKELIDESKNEVSKFIDIIKNSPLLQLEFKIFSNIENKHIDNELIASRYIDSNIKLFEIYTLEEIEKEHSKLKNFITENNVLDDSKNLLYESIFTLIEESLKDYLDVDVNKIHESYTFILKHIQEPKESLNQTIISTELINEDIIEIAVDKYNEKYSSLNENDKDLLQKLIKYNNKEKEELFETYKRENLVLLENANNGNVKENIEKAIRKIKEMKFNKAKIDDDIISLHELKKDLL